MDRGIVLTLQAGALGLVLLAVVLAVFAAGAYGLLTLARRAERRLPDAPPPEDADWAGDPFYEVSGRGRAAYLLLCLEGALERYGQNAALWRPLLERFWAVTAAPEEGVADWLETAFYLLPDAVLPYETFEDASAPAGYPWTAEQFAQARQCYAAAGWSMIVLNAVLQDFYLLVSGWDEGAPHQPDGLRLIADAENQMEAFGVPRPREGPALAAVREQKGDGPGAPFDGLALSALAPAADDADQAADADAGNAGADTPAFAVVEQQAEQS